MFSFMKTYFEAYAERNNALKLYRKHYFNAFVSTPCDSAKWRFALNFCKPRYLNSSKLFTSINAALLETHCTQSTNIMHILPLDVKIMCVNKLLPGHICIAILLRRYLL